ncbi:MAG: hypothetical protein OIF56_06900 [Cohaesibacter sp.]|nr:hypothetical protein [Cohaesibacter sp.]MCV6603058.1 hypothetical protein [Cohaesibacter sp.]
MNAQDIVSVLDGNTLGVIVRDFVSEQDCKTILKNFDQFESTYVRGSDAPAVYAGIYHYGKDLEDYFHQSQSANAHLGQLFENATNPIETFSNQLAQSLGQTGRSYRPAQWKDQQACHFVMRSWKDCGEFSLRPHDDEAQCKDPKQQGFEIQDAAQNNALGAVNICLANGQGGALRIWNVLPDDKARHDLGLEVTGSPYPETLLNAYSYLDIEIRPGDLYVFDGRYVHAVTQLHDGAKQIRATLAFLLCHKGEHETIQWC